MITIRKGAERRRLRRRKGEAWQTFPATQEQTMPYVAGFGHLRVLDEGRLAPRTAHSLLLTEDAEIITYIREGTLAFEDSTGRSELLSAGEFQRMTAGRGTRHGGINTSSTRWAHVFQFWLRPLVGGLVASHEQRLFSLAERRGVLRVVASPDGQDGSLLIHQDAFLYSTILERGQHVIHQLAEGRCAWLHIVKGAARCGTWIVGEGDGAGIVGEPGVSLTANEETEVLLLELSEGTSCQGAA